MEFASIWYATGGGAPAFVLTAGQVADTVMLRETLAATACPALRAGRAAPGAGDRRQGLPVEGQPRLAARARDQGDDPGVGRPDRPPPQRARPPIDFGRRQQERYRGRNVVELSVSKLKRWRAQPCAQTGPPATTTTRSAWPPPSTGSTPALATRPGRQGGTAWAGHRCGKGAIMCWCRMTLLPAARLAAARNYWLCTTTGCAPRRPRVPRTRPRCGEW